MPDFPARLSWAVRNWWREEARRTGAFGAAAQLSRELWGFIRDSTPERRRRRYGDMEYDWEHRVNTTSGTVGWRERLLGTFYSPYQPTDPAEFREIMAALPIDFSQFTFIDLGSGKGRTLLMASEYPFRRIVGVEILPELQSAAEENIRAYNSPTQRCRDIASICGDASDFPLAEDRLVLYFFNPLPESGLDRIFTQLEASLERRPRDVYVVYHNPVHEGTMSRRTAWKSVARINQTAIYRHEPLG